MECSTVYCDIDDYCMLLKQTRPKARKEHKCTECKRVIKQGESYLYEVTLYDGDLDTWKTCSDCEAIREEFFKSGYIYGEILFYLLEHIYNSEGDISERCISSLPRGARETVCRLIEDYWETQDEDD